MGFGVTELLVLLAIVLLLFGTRKLASLGGDLGTAIKGFRKAMQGDKDETEQQDAKPPESESGEIK